METSLVTNKEISGRLELVPGLVRFSPDFRPSPYPLGYLHIFFSTGGYWFLRIKSYLYGAKLLGVVREVNIGIGLGLGILVLFSGLFEYALIVFDGYYINPGVLTIGGIVGWGRLARKLSTSKKERKKGMKHLQRFQQDDY